MICQSSRFQASNEPNTSTGALPKDVYDLKWVELCRRFYDEASDGDFDLIDRLMQAHLARVIRSCIASARSGAPSASSRSICFDIWMNSRTASTIGARPTSTHW